MALSLAKHPDGPDVPAALRDRRFQSYVSMANAADEADLPDGVYWCRASNGTSYLTALRRVTRRKSGFHVEGRGNV